MRRGRTGMLGRALGRAVLGAALVGAARLPARAQPVAGEVAGRPTHFSRVSADVSRLRSLGLGPYAEAIRQDLDTALGQAFADRLTPGGPALVVRVIGVSMNMYAGSNARGGFGGNAMNTDYMEGEALVLGRRGEVVLRHPQLATQNASAGGAWYDPASERRRTAILAGTYAQWLRRAFE